MRHTRLAAFLGVLLALPAVVFARDPDPEASTLGRTHDPALDVVTNGVTKTRLGALYKDDLVVTDVNLRLASGVTNVISGTGIRVEEPVPGVVSVSVDPAATNLVAGDGVTISDFDGGRRISASGSMQSNTVEDIVRLYDETNLSIRITYARTNTLGVLRNHATAITDAQERIREGYGRIDAIETEGAYLRRSIEGLRSRVKETRDILQMPVSADVCHAYAAIGRPAIHSVYGNATSIYVRCSGGSYRDVIDVLSDDGVFEVQPDPSIVGMFGHTITKEQLISIFGHGILWTADFTPTVLNCASGIVSMCGGHGYPWYYGREPRSFELLCDAIASEPGLIASYDTSYASNTANFVRFSGLQAVLDPVDARIANLVQDITYTRRRIDGLSPIPTKVSDLTNDAEYVTADVTNGIPESIAAATNGLPELIAGSTNGLVSASNPMFADAVLAVGLNVSTNDVEAIHRILDEGGDIDWSEYGTVGGALVALIAGFAWLRRKAYASVTAAEVADGVWSLSDGPVTDGNKTSY